MPVHGEVRGEDAGRRRSVETLPAAVVAAGGPGVGVAELFLDIFEAGADSSRSTVAAPHVSVLCAMLLRAGIRAVTTTLITRLLASRERSDVTPDSAAGVGAAVTSQARSTPPRT